MKSDLTTIYNYFGKGAQERKTIEEMGELIAELAKPSAVRNNEKIKEELADVLNMVEQLALEYPDINEYRIVKIQRTLDYIENTRG